MQRAIKVKAGLGAALRVVQEGGGPLRRVFVEQPSLILVCRGEKRIRRGAETFVAPMGEMLAVAGGNEIEVTNAPVKGHAYEALCLSFDPDLCVTFPAISAAAPTVSGVAVLGRPPEFLLSAFQRAVGEEELGAEIPPEIARHHFQEVLLGLELLGWRFDLRSAARVSARVRRTLHSDPARRWDLSTVGKTLGMSEATLRRRLTQEGAGFRGLIAQVRMGRALTLLQSSDLSVNEIAYAVGYESVSQFTAKFRSHFGQSPGRLRKAS